MTALEPLTIGHGNGHNEHTLVDFVREAGVDSFGCNEADRLVPQLVKVPGTRLLTVPDGFRDRRAGDTPIVVRASRENLGELVRKASDALPKFERVAPARTLTAAFYAHPVADSMGYTGVAHFNIHPDAGPAALNGEDPDHPIVREYLDALTTTRLWMQAARRDGFLLVLTGDLQVGARHTKPWGPRAVLAKPMRLQTRVTHIDWLMFDHDLRLAAPPARHALFDHTGFTATLTAARKTAKPKEH